MTVPGVDIEDMDPGEKQFSAPRMWRLGYVVEEARAAKIEGISRLELNECNVLNSRIVPSFTSHDAVDVRRSNEPVVGASPPHNERSS